VQTEVEESRKAMSKTGEERAKYGETSKERDELRAHNIQLKKQILTISRDATKKTHHFQSELQATRQFLEELKMEMAAFAEQSRNEHELYRQKVNAEQTVLKSEFESYRAQQQELAREQHRDQHTLVQTLQAQFHENRTTAK
jgi:hypothetical protein